MESIILLISKRQFTAGLTLAVLFTFSYSPLYAQRNNDAMVPFSKRFRPLRPGKELEQQKQEIVKTPAQTDKKKILPGPTSSTSESVPEKTIPAHPLEQIQHKTYKYLIGYEDVLEIAVWRNEELSKLVIVRPDGKISLPLIGDVQASGLTPDQLRQRIVAKLKEYQEAVVVSVIVREVNSYNVFILGEVRTNGIQSLKRKTSLLQAVSLAGGFTQFASKNRILIIRQAGASEKEEKITIRFDDIIKDENSKANIILKPGDTIFVP